VSLRVFCPEPYDRRRAAPTPSPSTAAFEAQCVEASRRQARAAGSSSGPPGWYLPLVTNCILVPCEHVPGGFAGEPNKAREYRARDNRSDPVAGRRMQVVGHGNEHPDENAQHGCAAGRPVDHVAETVKHAGKSLGFHDQLTG